MNPVNGYGTKSDHLCVHNLQQVLCGFLLVLLLLLLLMLLWYKMRYNKPSFGNAFIQNTAKLCYY